MRLPELNVYQSTGIALFFGGAFYTISRRALQFGQLTSATSGLVPVAVMLAPLAARRQHPIAKSHEQQWDESVAKVGLEQTIESRLTDACPGTHKFSCLGEGNDRQLLLWPQDLSFPEAISAGACFKATYAVSELRSLGVEGLRDELLRLGQRKTTLNSSLKAAIDRICTETGLPPPPDVNYPVHDIRNPRAIFAEATFSRGDIDFIVDELMSPTLLEEQIVKCIRQLSPDAASRLRTD